MERGPLIVSAADAAYGRSLLQLLASVRRHEPACLDGVTVFDLGLTDGQRAILRRQFPCVRVHPFAWDEYPAFLRLRARPVNTNAWKPQVLVRVLEDATGPVLWLDSATVLTAPLARIVAQIRAQGVYVPFGGGSRIRRWTHPETAAFLGLDPEALSPRMRASGVVGLDPSQPFVRSLVERWAAACLDPACVAPPGSHRANHNFDQSVLNLLLLRERASRTLHLTDDALDISEGDPIPELRTRNKVPRWVPLAADPVVRAWFALRRAVDATVVRMQAHRVPAHQRPTPW